MLVLLLRGCDGGGGEGGTLPVFEPKARGIEEEGADALLAPENETEDDTPRGDTGPPEERGWEERDDDEEEPPFSLCLRIADMAEPLTGGEDDVGRGCEDKEDED